MRSIAGIASAVAILLALPLAVAAQIVSEGAADLVIHLAVGGGSMLLAVAVFDFQLPRWLTWLGALSAGAFGSIFLLQAASQMLPIEALRYLAFDVLGQGIESALPHVMVIWFVGLLVWDSHGKTRVVGAVVMGLIVAASVVNIVGPWVGLEVSAPLVAYILPFGWLLLESAKRRPIGASRSRTGTHDLVGSPAA